METDRFTVNMMVQSGKEKQEENQSTVRGRRLCFDQLNEDGIRKELYKKERKAQERWNERWGFLKNFEKLRQEELGKQNLPQPVFDSKIKQQVTSTEPECNNPAFELLPSSKVPSKTSEMIGWRLFSHKNELKRMAGSMYVSPKLSMNPPLGPDEPDITQQKIMYLG